MQVNVVDPSRGPGLAEDAGAAFRSDLEKFYRIELGTPTPGTREKLYLWAHHFGLHCVAIYRFGRYARALRSRRPLVAQPALFAARVLSYAMKLVHHVELSADIGPGLYIGHASSIFVGSTRIGSNFSLTHNVTVGIGHQRGVRGIPVIGDDVWVGTGSVIAGDLRVGRGVTISNGTMVSRDVPDGCLVGGNPARVLMQGYGNERLMGQAPTSDAPSRDGS
jgi:serine O-acetyltransferase